MKGARVILAVFLAAMWGAATARAGSFSDQASLLSPPLRAPSFLFTGRDGAQHTLADYRGRYVLLNFWATWCGPCRAELPTLDALANRLDAHKMVILPVAEDRDGDGIAAFYAAHNVTHLPVAVDGDDLAPSLFNLKGVPTTLIVDPQGLIVARVEGGGDWLSPAAFAFLDRATKNH
ncbi:MAG: TlpA family protein disulfide reductase [Alphaproteobacteria bacterium]|nr:TlpA family protein disulfide reductase [Alphaproteobacteria bacterium]